ncbi:hypothetical protein O181_092051 [Austropuccinia psidii MF-1]|uniref:Uncharacterized protein n=1 Tax=Austropuccinia psidii MF-1 TaxID=1389203 RepID=A0A9Q3PA83_9BASI|nr:hypothetical protein [Austropuccinia psidii MF-1]
MSYFIPPNALISHSVPPPTPTGIQLQGLTPDSIWSWFIHSLGWHEPALSQTTKRLIRNRFDSLPQSYHSILIRSDLIPHRQLMPDLIHLDNNSVLEHYAIIAAINKLAIRNIHRLFRDSNRNRVECYHHHHHQLWLPQAEIHWLRMRIDLRKQHGKTLDFPLSLRFVTRPSQYQTDPTGKLVGKTGQIRLMALDQRSKNGYWPIEFSQSARLLCESHSTIAFDHRQSALGINLPKNLTKIGYAWIENASYGPKNRILFKKSSIDELIGILLWPSFPDRSHPTPRIPVYQGDIIQLIDGDRLLIFMGEKRGIQDVLIQIELSAHWASTHDPIRTYADLKYIYPNPCERYPHCLQRPIYKPIDNLDPIILQDAIRPLSVYTNHQPTNQNTKIKKHNLLDTSLTYNQKHTEFISSNINKSTQTSIQHNQNQDNEICIDYIVEEPPETIQDKLSCSILSPHSHTARTPLSVMSTNLSRQELEIVQELTKDRKRKRPSSNGTTESTHSKRK